MIILLMMLWTMASSSSNISDRVPMLEHNKTHSTVKQLEKQRCATSQHGEGTPEQVSPEGPCSYLMESYTLLYVNRYVLNDSSWIFLHNKTNNTLSRPLQVDCNACY